MRHLVTALVITALTCAAPLFGQAFEVASIKPSQGPPATPAVQPSCSNGRFTARVNVLRMIQWAYSVGAYQVAGFEKLPVTRAYFSIEANAAGPMTEVRCHAMAQRLLTDRFKLEIHHESRSQSVYALVVAKNGPKIQPAADTDQDGVHINGAKMYGNPKGWTMDELADFLERSLAPTPVVDRSGLTGLYKMTLNFDPRPPGVGPASDLPDVFSAVELQLGLKLDQRKESIDTIVIDHVEQPESN